METILMQLELPAVMATVIGFILGICLTVILNQWISREKAKTFEEDLQRQIDGAKKESENIIKSAQIEAASEAIKRKEQFSEETNKIRTELREIELRLTKRGDTIDRQIEQTQQREKALKEQEKEIDRKMENVGNKEKQLSNMLVQQKNQLLKISAMNLEEAKDLLLTRLEDECEHEMSAMIQRKLEEANETVDEKSREIIYILE